MVVAPPHLLLVLGLPQAGTAQLQRILELCGAAVVACPEAEALQAQLLEAASSGWQASHALPDRWLQSDRAIDGAAGLNQALGSALASGGSIRVLFQPGLERLLPLWQQALAPLPLEPAYLLVLRHPLEVAEQLRRELGWSRDRALLVWLQSTLAMERSTRDQRRVVIEQEQLLWDADGALDQLEQGLGLQLPERNQERLLRWEQERPEPLLTSPQLAALPQASPLLTMALELHGWLQAEARHQCQKRLLPDVISEQLAWAEALYGRTLAEQEQQRQQAEQRLEQLESSRLVRLRRWFHRDQAA